jgi:hypothetical protein
MEDGANKDAEIEGCLEKISGGNHLREPQRGETLKPRLEAWVT